MTLHFLLILFLYALQFDGANEGTRRALKLDRSLTLQVPSAVAVFRLLDAHVQTALACVGLV